MGAIMGGHVRVGLEDSLYLGRGLLATSCSAQVLKIRRILEELSLRDRDARRGARHAADQGAGALMAAAATMTRAARHGRACWSASSWPSRSGW